MCVHVSVCMLVCVCVCVSARVRSFEDFILCNGKEGQKKKISSLSL